ncbi:MAG: ATP-grasp domain-containing protein [Chloroflexi bacterium]|nr:ATP-grasp domain-containing protein [Chloroflexota bacterium]
MKIGLAYDLKEAVAYSHSLPEDALEEYDSPETVQGIASALESLGHSTVRLGGGREFLTNILQNKVDFVFNIAEGRGTHRSRETQVPAVLEMLDIPYTGSDPQCLAICLDKPLTKKLVAMSGIRTPKWLMLASPQQLGKADWGSLSFPVFLKPAYEGSSKGIRLSSKFDTPEQAALAASELIERYQQPVMVEEFIAGDEVTVGVIGNSPTKIMGIMRVVPRENGAYFVYSLEVKRDWERLVEYECPAKLKANTLQEITENSLKAFEVLGCRDFSRVDFRVDREGKPYFLEINPLPGLNPKSGDYVIMAKKMGWSYEALLSAILDAAIQRYPKCLQG